MMGKTPSLPAVNSTCFGSPRLTTSATLYAGIANPCWLGSDGTLLISLTLTFVPFFTTRVVGPQIFVPSASTFTTVKLMPSAWADGACAPRTKPSPATTPITIRRMRLLLLGGSPASSTLPRIAQRGRGLRRFARAAILPRHGRGGVVPAPGRLRSPGGSAPGDPRARGLGAGRGAASGAARRDRQRQDVHRVRGDRRREQGDARDRAQQDARRTAVPRVPDLLPGERGALLRQLLRLLPAGSVRPLQRHLHRQGRVDQRRDRQNAARRHEGAARAQRRAGRRERLMHLRPRLAGVVFRHAGRARAKRHGR